MVNGQVPEEVLVKALSSLSPSPSPSPPPRTPPTKSGGALYGLDFTGDGVGARDAGPPQGLGLRVSGCQEERERETRRERAETQTLRPRT